MKKSTTNKLLENCLNQLDVQQIDEGLWDRTKAKAAGLGSFITGKFGEKSKSYQTTAQSKLIDSKINKIKKIISDLEVDIIKSTGMRMSDIQTRYPNIYDELQKISNAINAPLSSAPSPPPLPATPTFQNALNLFLRNEGITRNGLDYQKTKKFLDAYGADTGKILRAAGLTPSLGVRTISNAQLNTIKNELISAGILT